ESADPGAPPAGPAPITNRLDGPPEVVNNLGITYVTATRDRLGVWEEVPGELEVPEHRRWTLRSPVDARVVSVLPRWQVVEEDTEVVVLASSAIREVRRAIDLAERTGVRARAEGAAARARLEAAATHLPAAQAFGRGSRNRLGELEALGGHGNALTAREILEARRTVTEAGRATLDAAIARDDLSSRVASREIEAEQARLA